MQLGTGPRSALIALWFLIPACDSGAVQTTTGDRGSLPTRFYGCPREPKDEGTPCEVAFEAFGDWCGASRSEPLGSLCATQPFLSSGPCGDVFIVQERASLDIYRCGYDVSGRLVGAEYEPDAAPLQYAGVRLPTGCSLTLECVPGEGQKDAGRGDAGTVDAGIGAPGGE